MLTYLIYPSHYWPEPFYYWPIIIDIPPYNIIEPCETAIWIPDEILTPTGNEYHRVETRSSIPPFAVWKP